MLETNPAIISNAARFPYLKDAYHAAFNVGLDNYSQVPFVHFITLYGLARENGSCHDVLFGETKPVELRGQVRGVLKAFMNLPINSKALILSDLCSNPSYLTNPVYLSHRRYDALAKEEGCQLNQWFINYSTTPDRFRQTISFTAVNIPFEDHLDSRRSISFGASSLWWMAFLVCPKLDISVDYLYRLDYSNIALLDNHQLADLEHIFLGSYLSADENRQINCRRLIATFNMDAD